MTDFDSFYWLLDVRFDFLIPSFLEEYGINKEDLVVVNSFHGREREESGYGKIITLKSDEWKDKEGVVQEEPDDLNRLFVKSENLVAQLNAGMKIFVAAFTGVGLPEHENLVTLTSTGDIAKNINNKKRQAYFFQSNQIATPEMTSYKKLKRRKLKEDKRVVLKHPFLSGGYRTKIASSQEELKKIVEETFQSNNNNEVLISEYIEHDSSYATMGIAGEDGNVHVFEVVDEQMLHEEVQYEGLLYPAQISPELKESLLTVTEKVGKSLVEDGYRGFFNIDFIEAYDRTPYAIEINARITFGTILIALLYKEKNIWKILRGIDENGKPLPVRIPEPEVKHSIVIGKFKAKEGNEYGNVPSKSDIYTWWNDRKVGASFENIFITPKEKFLYGSYMGIFGTKFAQDESRKRIINKFRQKMMQNYQPQKKLLGIYVENYKGFEHANIWFSAIHDKMINISYEKDSFSIAYKSFPNALKEDFFDNTVSSISTLVGEGGSGKTTILWLICHWMGELSKGRIPDQTGAIIVEERNQQGIFAFADGKEREVSGGHESIQHYRFDAIKAFAENIRIVYYSNTISGRKFENRVAKDISVTNMLRRTYNRFNQEKIRDSLTEADLIERYFEQQQDKFTQILLLKKYPHGNRVIKVIVTKFTANEENELLDTFKPEIDTMLGIAEHVKVSQIAMELLKSLIGYLLQGFGETQPERLRGEISGFMRMIKNDKSPLSLIDALKQLITGCWPTRESTEYKILFINLVESIFLLFKDDASEGWGYDEEESTEKEYVFRYCIDNKDIPDFRNLWKYYNGYKKFEKSENIYVKLRWDLEYLGSGEMNNLGLFANLLPENIDSKAGDNIWILLDEPDNSLSPEISRRFVSDFISFCEDQYAGSHVQTWMTTNSPIVLSDIPAQYVRYLKSRNRRKSIELGMERTFIANIYELLQNGYFLEKAVGEFALDKVNKLTYELKNIESTILDREKDFKKGETFEKLDSIERQVDLISETGTRYSLKRGLKRCRNLLEG